MVYLSPKLQCLLQVVTDSYMGKVTITEAAKLIGISRQHLYRKYVNTGDLSVIKEDKKTLIDMSELIRVFPDIKNVITGDSKKLHHVTEKTTNVTHSDSTNTELIETLKQQLKEAKEREEWLRSQIDELRKQQNNRLEDQMPKKSRKWLGIF